MTAYPELLIWWTGTITAGIVFLIAVSVVLYFVSRGERRIGGVIQNAKNFAFVWVLLVLLILYIVSIDGGNYSLFAIGNVVIEVVIFTYLLASKKIASSN